MAATATTPPSALRLERRRMDQADEVKAPNRARVEVVRLQGRTFTRFTFLPGFHWKVDVGAMMGRDACPADHVMYQVSGRLGVRMQDGTEAILEPGEAQVLPAGHDVWVLGDQPWVAISID